jgi:hypothetical protein
VDLSGQLSTLSEILAESIEDLQGQIDSFVRYYNEKRPHQARGCPPMHAWRTLDNATPEVDGQPLLAKTKVRRHHVDHWGSVTLRYRHRLRHISVGRAHRHQAVLILMATSTCASSSTRLNFYDISPWIRRATTKPGRGVVSEGSNVPTILRRHSVDLSGRLSSLSELLVDLNDRMAPISTSLVKTDN